MRKLVLLLLFSLLIVLVQCSAVKHTPSKQEFKINFSKILISTTNIENTLDLNFEIAYQIKKMLTNDNMEVEVYSPIKFDSAIFSQILHDFTPDVILSFIPVRYTPYSTGFIFIDYEYHFFQHNAGNPVLIKSGAITIYHRNDQLKRNITSTSKLFYNLVKESRIETSKNNR